MTTLNNEQRWQVVSLDLSRGVPELSCEPGYDGMRVVFFWKRALLGHCRLTSAQLSTYFVGATEHLDLRAAEQKKLGDQFNLKKYNDQVISYGSPPVKYVRELMGL